MTVASVPVDDVLVRNRSSWVAALLRGEWRDGVTSRARVHPYKKWGGAHWRLIALAELDVDPESPDVAGSVSEAFDEIAAWLLAPGRVERASRRIRGRSRICGSQDGAAVWAASRLGLAADPRVDVLVAHLVAWQWPDGGWNCDKRPSAAHSSFNESWMPARGLAAYRLARLERAADPALAAAADAASEFLLRHRVVESERTGDVADPRLLELRWPPYWHYGLLPGLLALEEARRLGDARVTPALDRLQALRSADGQWHPTGRFWHGPGSAGSNVEVVAWGRDGETAMLTHKAREVLAVARSAGQRLSTTGPP